MKLKATCCKKYRKKAEACKRCPLMASLSKKRRRQRIEQLRKRASKAA